ncbi:MAG: SDR family oxidoreductase [Pseudomonadota bacterium]
MRGRVLITGAGSGIGRACARFLAEEGFHILAAGRRADPLSTLAQEKPGSITPVVMDVTKPHSIEGVLSAISPIDAVVNNAGIAVMGPLEAVSLEDWRRVFETNVFGIANVCRAVLPQMRQRGKGRIIQIGSVAGRVTPPFHGVYGAAKHAVEGFTDALRREVEPHGLFVSLIRPGFINTSFGEQEQETLAAYRIDGYTEQVDAFAHWHREKGHKAAPGPIVVAQTVERALTDLVPKARYACPRQAQLTLALRQVLPDRVIDKALDWTIRWASRS